MADLNSELPIRTQLPGQVNYDDVVIKIGDGTTSTQLASVDTHGSLQSRIADASGNVITSQASGSQRALDVGINVAGVQIDPRSIRALTSSDIVTAAQGSANTTANAWPMKITDGTNTAAVKAASTAAAAADPSLVVAFSPNSPLPTGSNVIGSVNQGTSPWIVKDQSDGPVTPGAVASFSQLAGGQYNSSAPTLTTGQQAALQLTSAGALITSSSFSNDTNYGTVGANTLRVAAQIGNSGGAADFNAGATGAQTLRTVSNQGAANTLANAWAMKITDATNGPAAVKAASTAAAAADPALVVSLSPNSPLPTGSNAIGSVLANLQVSSAAVSSTNPVPVSISSTIPGTSVQNYATATVAAAGTSNHVYTVTSGKTLNLQRIWATASGKLKIEVQIETGVATGVYNTKFVGFNSTATPNIDITVVSALQVAAGVRVQIIRTNNDKASEDVYSTIEGTEV